MRSRTLVCVSVCSRKFSIFPVSPISSSSFRNVSVSSLFRCVPVIAVFMEICGWEGSRSFQCIKFVQVRSSTLLFIAVRLHVSRCDSMSRPFSYVPCILDSPVGGLYWHFSACASVDMILYFSGYRCVQDILHEFQCVPTYLFPEIGLLVGRLFPFRLWGCLFLFVSAFCFCSFGCLFVCFMGAISLQVRLRVFHSVAVHVYALGFSEHFCGVCAPLCILS